MYRRKNKTDRKKRNWKKVDDMTWEEGRRQVLDTTGWKSLQ